MLDYIPNVVVASLLYMQPVKSGSNENTPNSIAGGATIPYY